MPKFQPRNLKSRPKKKLKKKKGKWIVKFNLESERSKHSLERLLVPWMSKYEWQTVKQKIFSSDIDDKISALHRLSVWRNRCHGRVPLAIEVTDVLLRAYIQDQKSKNSEEAQILQGNLVMLYSSAIIRFVNLVTEMGQKGSSITPVHVIAEKMQIHDWLVEIRHEASHANFPALTTLQTAFHLAMKWIETHYWDLEATRMTDLGMTKESLDEIIANEKLKKQLISPEGKIKSWELATDQIDWIKYPLGLIPSQIEEIPFLDLILPASVDKLYPHQLVVLNKMIDNEKPEIVEEEEEPYECWKIPNLEDRLLISKYTRAPHLWTDEEIGAIQRSIIIF